MDVVIYSDRDSLSEELEILRLMLARDEIFPQFPVLAGNLGLF